MPDYSIYTANDFILDAYFQQEVLSPTAETQRYWRNFRLLHPEKESALEQAQTMIRALHQGKLHPDLDQLEQEWNLLSTAVNGYERERNLSAFRWPVRFSVAASVALCLLLGGIWWYAAQPTVVRYSTDFNETKIIHLPDGSTVTLNANSTLSFRDNWSATLSERRVALEGEAFFAVEKNLIHHQDSAYFSKFIVQTSQLEIEVLGTRFNVNDHVSNTQVALESGKVLVKQEGGNSLYLIPGEVVELINHGLHKKTTEVKTVSSWKDNKLIFKQTPVPEILEMIENRYGYRIKYNPASLKNKRYTGSSPVDDVDLLLYKISRLYGLSIQSEGENVTLTPNPLH